MNRWIDGWTGTYGRECSNDFDWGIILDYGSNGDNGYGVAYARMNYDPQHGKISTMTITSAVYVLVLCTCWPSRVHILQYCRSRGF